MYLGFFKNYYYALLYCKKETLSVKKCKELIACQTISSLFHHICMKEFVFVYSLHCSFLCCNQAEMGWQMCGFPTDTEKRKEGLSWVTKKTKNKKWGNSLLKNVGLLSTRPNHHVAKCLVY